MRRRGARRLSSLGPWLGLALAGAPAHAAPDPDPDPGARVVRLRASCDVQGQPLENCFESMEALSDPATGWIWNARSPRPEPDSPLLVEIGPGRFGPFTCPAGGAQPNGYVTLRGAGRQVSQLAGNPAASADACEQLEFVDLGLHAEAGPTPGAQLTAVRWLGGGSSVWSNTDLVTPEGPGGSALRTAWEDACPGPVGRALHYFHGSRVRATGNAAGLAAFHSTCGETWFYGGEIQLVVTSGTTSQGLAIGVHLTDRGELRAFGTAIRVAVRDPVALFAVAGIGLYGGSAPILHAHGAVLNVSGEGATNAPPTFGIWATGDAFAHTPGSAFVVRPAEGGVARRVEQSVEARVLSPFLWQAGATPPMASGEQSVVGSEDGQDLFVETDCDAGGDCNGAGNETHLMIYAEEKCGAANPWFDVVTRACRR